MKQLQDSSATGTQDPATSSETPVGIGGPTSLDTASNAAGTKTTTHKMTYDVQAAVGWFRVQCSCGDESPFYRTNTHGNRHTSKWIVKHGETLGVEPDISELA